MHWSYGDSCYHTYYRVSLIFPRGQMEMTFVGRRCDDHRCEACNHWQRPSHDNGGPSIRIDWLHRGRFPSASGRACRRGPNKPRHYRFAAEDQLIASWVSWTLQPSYLPDYSGVPDTLDGLAYDSTSGTLYGTGVPGFNAVFTLTPSTGGILSSLAAPGVDKCGQVVTVSNHRRSQWLEEAR